MLERILSAEAFYVVVLFLVTATANKFGLISGEQFEQLFSLFFGYASLTLLGQAGKAGVAKVRTLRNGGTDA